MDEFANVSLSDLQVLTTLGVGSFGRVHLALIRGDSTRSFALKKIKKALMVKMDYRRHIISEKQVMNQVNSDFIVKLHKTFKDDKYLFMLMECCLGGELFSIVQRERFLSEPDTKFYIACIVKALEHLHSMNIVYRDLKPENLLLDHQGYLKMTDFGFAKRLDLNERTRTVCGTPEYRAPEMVLVVNGHDIRCDYWSLGAILLELLTGRQAFLTDDRAIPKIYSKILKGLEAQTLRATISNDAKALILSLCQMEPEKRLDGGSISQVETHPWFHGFDWVALTRRTMVPPFLPEIKNATDTSNFDTYAPDTSDPPAVDSSGWDVDF